MLRGSFSHTFTPIYVGRADGNKKNIFYKSKRQACLTITSSQRVIARLKWVDSLATAAG